MDWIISSVLFLLVITALMIATTHALCKIVDKATEE